MPWPVARNRLQLHHEDDCQQAPREREREREREIYLCRIEGRFREQGESSAARADLDNRDSLPQRNESRSREREEVRVKGQSREP
ncbi:hypothetical protein KFK09_012203 [Dendrobium nobile]|uniref:Uncharacterized protein n=1 Tax=Dendrobium nobile TaxID=94219 RepID=A0A8T3BGM3_DENNO|nr:hypothetical protein KFK09_012203 [Dendrobium nobile]